MAGDEANARDAEFWRKYLDNPDSLQTLGRHLFRRLPSEPRCQLCAAPFAGLGRTAMRAIGKRQSDGNPRLCTSCQSVLIKYHGGGEVDGALLFADVRGSTSIAERLTPGDYRALLDRFYTVTSEACFEHGGIVDKFVGDELVAMFPPMLGARYAERAIHAAQGVLRATGHTDTNGPWIPVGAGVHSGPFWFGAVGQGLHTEVTIVGDLVNITSRLASLAKAGEILASVDAAVQAGLPTVHSHPLAVKGRAEPIDVVSLSA